MISDVRLRVAAVALAGTAVAALAIGIPTDVVPNPWFTRMTPVRAADYLFLTILALLSGALLATYVLPRDGPDHAAGGGIGGGLLGSLAVGCPVCNKLVVALIGFSGAFEYFAPIQPLLGVLAILLVGSALWVRVRSFRRACALPTPALDRRPAA